MYNAEEGESRWSALRRRNQVLEGERDEACELLTLMQSQPEIEALEVYHRVRTHPQDNDMSTLIHDARRICAATASPQQPPQHQQAPYSHQFQQRDHHQRIKPQTRPQQQRSLNTSDGPSASATGTTSQLPPLRSIIQDLHTPAASSNAKQQTTPETSSPARPAQHQISQASGMSNRSHLSLSSSDRQEQYPLSPREASPPNRARRSDQ